MFVLLLSAALAAAVPDGETLEIGATGSITSAKRLVRSVAKTGGASINAEGVSSGHTASVGRHHQQESAATSLQENDPFGLATGLTEEKQMSQDSSGGTDGTNSGKRACLCIPCGKLLAHAFGGGACGKRSSTCGPGEGAGRTDTCYSSVSTECNCLTLRAEREPVDCVWANWWEWEECSESCGTGDAERTRAVSVPAAHGGKQCPGTPQETKECNTDACPTTEQATTTTAPPEETTTEAAAAPAPEEEKGFLGIPKKFVMPVVITCVIATAALGGGGYFYMQQQKKTKKPVTLDEFGEPVYDEDWEDTGLHTMPLEEYKDDEY